MVQWRFAAVAAFCALLIHSQASAAPSRRARPRFGSVTSPLSLVARDGAPIALDGLHSYFGRIEVRDERDGLVAVNRLPLERYLLGLNEVPPDWPQEALRAQAVAARTYALWTLARGRTGVAGIYGFDICASVSCQVFSGADVIRTPQGDRWADAVAATAGQAVTFNGEPILARYHSTSGGRTLDNSDAFPLEGDYPYLQSVRSDTEEASPLWRWRVRFPLEILEAMLSRAGLWNAGLGRLRDVTTRPSSTGLHYPDVVFTGSKRRLRITAEQLRDIVRELAPSMFPGRYPSRAPTTSGFLPETLPSNRLKMRTRANAVHVIGRGWGHGVGMSQWGAHGLAKAGRNYVDILGHYYTGTEVEEVDSPARVDVGLAWGLESIGATGSFDIVDGRGRALVERGLGRWELSWQGAGVVRIKPPRGFGLPLRIAIVDSPRRVEPGERVTIRFALSKPARVGVDLGDGGRIEPRGRIHSAGRGTIAWTAPRDPGAYRVRLAASTGRATTKTDLTRITVASAERTPPDRERAPQRGVPGLAVVATVLLGIVVALFLRSTMAK